MSKQRGSADYECARAMRKKAELARTFDECRVIKRNEEKLDLESCGSAESAEQLVYEVKSVSALLMQSRR